MGKGQLIDVKNEHQRKEALIDGKAEVMTELANSDAHLYFTPAECDLRLGMSTVKDERRSSGRKGKKENIISNDDNKMRRNSLYNSMGNNNGQQESKLFT